MIVREFPRRCHDCWFAWPPRYRIVSSIATSAFLGQLINLLTRGHWGLS